MAGDLNLKWLANKLTQEFTGAADYGRWLESGLKSITTEEKLPLVSFDPGRYIIGDADPWGAAWMKDMAVVYKALPPAQQSLFREGFTHALTKTLETGNCSAKLASAYVRMAKHADPLDYFGIPPGIKATLDPSPDTLTKFITLMADQVNRQNNPQPK